MWRRQAGRGARLNVTGISMVTLSISPLVKSRTLSFPPGILRVYLTGRSPFPTEGPVLVHLGTAIPSEWPLGRSVLSIK